ncbi:MAG: hypothetical protein AB9917_00165 [Negativicutes bacterium]
MSRSNTKMILQWNYLSAPRDNEFLFKNNWPSAGNWKRQEEIEKGSSVAGCSENLAGNEQNSTRNLKGECKMKQIAVGATTHIDRHNCKINKDALEQAAHDIKNGGSVPAIGIEHDMACPPLGKITDAWIEPMEDGEFRMLIVQNIFDSRKEISLSDGIIAFEEKLMDDDRPFTMRIDKQAPDKMKIQADFVNFKTKHDFDSFFAEIKEVGDIDQESIMRKSLIPDPEMIITLANSIIAYIAGTSLLDKTAERVADDIATSYEIIKKAIISMAKYCIPPNRPITYIYEIPGEIGIELLVRTNIVSTHLPWRHHSAPPLS